ncbi:hypothetical protein EKG37_01185 [Robertmurraya yapensis]|uniref:Uncharacterized protein n=1 Tax=Bacillus yapensis TaxID=2492960 RepID=A0A431WL49_9BACI|nr:hypothetical protein [Bacillus yapensis]RTR36201.1 hypothetical protein EKG37_01185 [Bacillus yapensis]TKT05704.1 hypothetical protein FAR12_01185 [Bacillus yapensis]
MKKEWGSFKSIEGSLLWIYANQLCVYQDNETITLHSMEPILKIRIPDSSETSYWRINWKETDLGDDILLLKEQDNPEPLDYESVDWPEEKHTIMSSSFFLEQNNIQKVSGYGFEENGNELLSSIVLEMDDRFISIEAGPVITIKVTTTAPDDSGKLLF